MRRLQLLCIAVSFIAINTLSARVRVLALGDSWITEFSILQAFEPLLQHHGIEAHSVAHVDLPGSQAKQWNSWAGRLLIKTALAFYRDTEIVVISLAGNDVMRTVSIRQKPSERQRNFQRIKSHLATIIDFILHLRPTLKIVLVGYDYPNFEPASSNWLIRSDIEMWHMIGRPSVSEVNHLMLQLGALKSELAGTRPQVYYLCNFGFLQSLAAQTHPSFSCSIEAPGGDPNFPSPASLMLEFPGHIDAIHLSKTAMLAIAKRVIDFILPLMR